MEIWKKIKDFPCYEVSNMGNVRTNKRNRLLIGTRSKVYHQVHMRRGNEKKTVGVHRLVAMAFIPNPLNKKCINHKNGIKDDNRVENLEWATHTDNLIHAYRTGLRQSRKGKPVKHKKEETTLSLF